MPSDRKPDHEPQSVKPPTRDATIEDIAARLVSRKSQEDASPLLGWAAAMWDWDLMMNAIEDATGRFRVAAAAGDGLAARASVGEALWWITSADEYLWKRVSFEFPKQKDYYIGIGIGKTDSGRLMGALTYLRNRAGHQIAQVLAEATTVATPFQVREEDGSVHTSEVTWTVSRAANPAHGAPDSDYVFVSPDHLPPPDPAFQERHDRDAWYAERVAGRSSAEVLEEMLASLKKTIRIERTVEASKAVVAVHLGWTINPAR